MKNPSARHDAARTRELKLVTRQVWFAVALVAAIALLYTVYYHSGSLQFYRKMTIAAAVLLLVLRFLLRRSSKGKRSRAAEPDPRSRLNLQ